jgi:hypothetical protein
MTTPAGGRSDRTREPVPQQPATRCTGRPRSAPAGRSAEPREGRQRHGPQADGAGAGLRQDVAEDLHRRPRQRGHPRAGIAAWKADFGRFWPRGNAFPRRAHRHRSRGRRAARPLDARRRPAVDRRDGALRGRRVLHPHDAAGPHVRGWITGSAFERTGSTMLQAQVLMRANDPLYEVGLTLGRARKEDRFWCETLAPSARTWASRRRDDHPGRLRRQAPAVAQGRQRLAQRRGAHRALAAGAPLRKRRRRRADATAHGREPAARRRRRRSRDRTAWPRRSPWRRRACRCGCTRRPHARRRLPHRAADPARLRHDVCSAVHPLALAIAVPARLDLPGAGLRLLQPDVALAHPLPDGRAAVLRGSVDDTAAGLGEDGAAYASLLAPASAAGRTWSRSC